MTAGAIAARSGAQVEIISPERFFAPDMGGMNHAPYMRAFLEARVQITINTRVTAIKREGNELAVRLGSDFALGWADERRVDQLVADRGIAPMEERYFALQPLSRKLGAVNYGALAGEGEVVPAA